MSALEQISSKYLSSKDAKSFAAELKLFLPGGVTSISTILKGIVNKLESIDNKQLLSLADELNQAGILGIAGLEEETFQITKEVFNIYVERKDYKSATAFLSKAPLLKDDFRVDQAERFQTILNLITAYLEIKQSISCEPLLMKAHELASKVKDKDLLIQYNYCCGQYYNFNRKFLLSGLRYYAACNIDSTTMKPDWIADMLSKVIDVTILAPTGSKKSFLVANLIKDDRAKSFKNYQLLNKINKEVLISREEIDDFCKGLGAHQNIREKDGFTNVEKVFLEHNIIVISKFYRDISIESLADRLKIKRNELETILQNMKNEEKVSMSIDHLSGFIEFNSNNTNKSITSASLATFCFLLDKFQV